ESGSGKSTMARLLIGLERPTQGKILIDGEDTGKWTYNQWRRHRTKIQAVFQDATGSLNRQFSVARNLEEPLRNLTKLTSQERKARILELMDLTATSRKLLDTPARNLSGGEQRRVALLRALAVRPDYLILDELTSGLDLISQKAIREVLEAYHREYRCSYLLITHDMKFAYSLSQRIYELERGQIIRIGQSNIDINSKNPKERT
ncbi:MAG TPA: ATP-binding cassette domain-containing protein, partial [Methanocorpusculum sp.]|nr:ATP-binding cassette domain-containing protein [Methanocorpusculum sp.]